MKVLELFGGYGSQALALENLGYDFTSDLCEIDKYAIQAYNQLHGETHNWGDICKIDETKLPYYDLITYSSPCQDFSVSGKQAGGDKGSGTRSSLLWECERIIRAVKPKYLLMENDKKESGVYYVSTPGGMIRTAIVSDGKVYTGERDDKTVYKVLERVPNEIMIQAYLSTFSKERG